MIDLSIVIPSIRFECWPELLENIAKCCTRHTYEVIFVGPQSHPCINGTSVNQNIKFVRDLGSPNRCQQIGLTLAEGKYVTWLVDDYERGPTQIDEFVDNLVDTEWNTIVIGNYDEAGVLAVQDFSIKKCYGGGHYVDPEWQIFNVAFMHREFLEHLGGFDCSFDVTCLGHTDLAARAQACGGEIVSPGLHLGAVRHVPDTNGDHGPVHFAQLGHDQPLFNNKTSRPIEPLISMDNWKNSSSVWHRRFK
jgi:hypothetical protein